MNLISVLPPLVLLVLLLALDQTSGGAVGSKEPASCPSTGTTTDYFFDSFDEGWDQRWTHSELKKYAGRFASAPRRHAAPRGRGGGDTAITVPEPNRRYALAAPLPRGAVDAGAEGLVVQYEAQFTDTHGCGGAYVKLLAVDPLEWDPKRVGRRTPYSVMFGPDRCGGASRVHLILKLHNPALGNATEHHLASPPTPPNDRLPHVYTLLLLPPTPTPAAADGSGGAPARGGRYRVLIDGEEAAAGDLAADGGAAFEPPLLPPREVPDPEDAKPADWDDREEIDDPAAVKPAGWDNRRMIPDLDAKKPAAWLDDEPPLIPDPTAAPRPADWDDARDGAWAPPAIPNPKCDAAPGCGPWQPPLKRNPNYKGVWLAPRIKNPAYRGEWAPRRVPNPAYFKPPKNEGPLRRLAPVGAVAFEILATEAGYVFDGVLVGPASAAALAAAAAYRRDAWRRRYAEEYAAAEAAHRRAQIATAPAPARWLMLAFEAAPLDRLRPRAVPFLELLWRAPALAHALVTAPALLAAAALAAASAARLRASGGSSGDDGGRGRPASASSPPRERSGDGDGNDDDGDGGGRGGDRASPAAGQQLRRRAARA